MENNNTYNQETTSSKPMSLGWKLVLVLVFIGCAAYNSLLHYALIQWLKTL